MTSGDRLFILLCAWTAAAGSLVGNGLAHHVLWLFIAGVVASAVCPFGVIAASMVTRKSRTRH